MRRLKWICGRMRRLKWIRFPKSVVIVALVGIVLVVTSYLFPVEQQKAAMTPIPETLNKTVLGEEAQQGGDVVSVSIAEEAVQPAVKTELSTGGTGLQEASSTDQAQESDAATSLEEYRLKRAKAHASAKEVLETIIQDSNTTREMRSQAQEELIALSKTNQQELTVENLLQLRYGGEAVVFISQGQATAALQPKNPPTEDTVALAARLVADYTGLDYENIVVLVMD